jgi:hypothetical protein
VERGDTSQMGEGGTQRYLHARTTPHPQVQAGEAGKTAHIWSRLHHPYYPHHALSSIYPPSAGAHPPLACSLARPSPRLISMSPLPFLRTCPLLLHRPALPRGSCPFCCYTCAMTSCKVLCVPRPKPPEALRPCPAGPRRPRPPAGPKRPKRPSVMCARRRQLHQCNHAGALTHAHTGRRAERTCAI